MGKGWKAARAMLASNLCVTSASSRNRNEPPITSLQDLMAMDKQPASPITKRSKSTGRSICEKASCSICLDPMKPGAGQALFTAECSHMFHFSCIASNVRHGNRICPVCRAKWVDLPWSTPTSAGTGSSILNRGHYDVDPVLRILNESIQRERARFNNAQAAALRLGRVHEPTVYDDDDALSTIPTTSGSVDDHTDSSVVSPPRITVFPEYSAVPAGESRNPFTILVNVKAPPGSGSRAPVDLITVLDVSGSMAGAKLALVKSAVEFVIGQLSSRDRMSVVAFSTSATRIFPLKSMTDSNKRRAVRSVQALAASGGTNISDGLRKAVKVLLDRRHRNAVSGVMLLSDGQDTSAVAHVQLAAAVRRGGTPVHTFGFGSDHDAATLHGISESTRGTFSFVSAAGSVRDAFAQCVGGLLSVSVQNARLRLSSKCRMLKIEGCLESGISENGYDAVVGLGDLYADEERDILLEINLSSGESREILTAGCEFRSITGEELKSETCRLSIRREQSGAGGLSILVDRQRNRLLASESMARAGSLADSGDFAAAQALMGESKRKIEASAAFSGGDLLSRMLVSEMGEVLQRMENRRVYEDSGRAFALSAHSSHSHQRATARHAVAAGDEDQSFYQTASMAEMVHLSQTFGKTSSGPVRPPSSSRIGRSKSSRKVNPSRIDGP